VIFNNAGMNRPRSFMEVDEANFEEIVRVNTWGVIVCTQEAAKQMIAQGSGGKIVNTGSIASRQGFWDFVPYCVAKFGTLAVTQATARGLIEHGITVNAFAPGVVDTPMWVGLNEDIRAIHGQPDDADPMPHNARSADVQRHAAQSTLMPPCLMTLAHRWSSSAMTFCRSALLPQVRSAPSLSNCSCVSGNLQTSCKAAASF